MTRHALLALLFLAVNLSAQKLPLDEPGGRVLQLIDVRKLLPEELSPNGATAKPDELAAFVRSFIAPPLGAGDDVRGLGDHHIVVLGSPEQVACAEQIVATAMLRCEDEILVLVHLAEVPPATYQKCVQPLLDRANARGPEEGAVRQMLFGANEAKAVTALIESLKGADGANLLVAPRLVTKPSRHVVMSVGETITSVRDFKLKSVRGSKIADPVLDKIHDGWEVEVTTSHFGKDQLGVSCAVLLQEVQKPIPTFTTTLGLGMPITLQLPRFTGIHMRQSVAMQDGGAALLAAPKSEGNWVIAVLQARTVKK